MTNYADRGWITPCEIFIIFHIMRHPNPVMFFFSYILCTYWLSRRAERENIWLEVRTCGPRAAVRTHGHHFLQPRSGVFSLFFLEARGRTLVTRFALVKQLSHAFCPFSIIDVDWYWYRRILSKFENSWLRRICQRIWTNQQRRSVRHMIFDLVPLLPGRTLRLIQCSEAEVLSFCVRLLLSSLKVIKSL